MKILPSNNSYGTFCDLLTGYRTFSVLIQAVESGVIDFVGAGRCTVHEALAEIGIREEEGRRFIGLLLNLGLLEEYDGHLYLSRFSRTYLYRESPLSQLNVLEFEKVLVEKWNGLGALLLEGQGSTVRHQAPEEYRTRLSLFQKAMGEAALVRSKELWDAVPDLPETGVIVDVGAGDGTYLSEFLKRYPRWQAIACDLSDVCALAGGGNGAILWERCNVADPRECGHFVSRHAGTASVLLLSNIIHCYDTEENMALLRRLAPLLNDGGRVIIHDFFRDGNSFGAMYDLHMMVNTFNGRTYTIGETLEMLQRAEMEGGEVIELPSYSHAVVGGRGMGHSITCDPLYWLRREALSLGFFEAAFLEPAAIASEPWVRAKCRFGCSLYGRKWSCPPHSLDPDEFEELLAGYSKALVVAGQAPLRDFQEKLLDLEKRAFLGGFKKALVFSGGPCTWCDECGEDRCLFPEKRRPSLESCGCDVFALAASCGITVAPLQSPDEFVQFIGLLLVE